ncbi:hypothetical protein B2G52_03660 [Neisseria lactamica]|uniref:Uncharacterized protein n=1 Tax=Neisseria lactamica TaxID=486 RepID=A0AAU8VEX7_NEILA|nr:hypothetical protein B2G52_03660 [Neisseria lactamica]
MRWRTMLSGRATVCPTERFSGRWNRGIVFGGSDGYNLSQRRDGNGHYSGLNLNQYSVASPCRTICTVCGFVALS